MNKKHMGYLAVALFWAAGTATAGINWETDFARAKERALKEDKLLFLEFYANW